MIRRFQEVFWPPKWKAALAAIFCFALAILLFSTSVFAIIGPVPLFYGLWYGGVWLFKFSHDQQLAAQAKADEQRQLQQARQVAPSRTTPESSQLFVPTQFPDEF
jgi:hypothetical protein